MKTPIREEKEKNKEESADSAKPSFSLEKGSLQMDSSESAHPEGKLTLDIYETDRELIFLAPMAGVEPGNIQVHISEDILTIFGERTFPNGLFPDEKYPFLEECYWGKFSRSVILPSAVNSEDVTAEFKTGLLTVHVPKAKKAKSKVVPIEIR